MKTTITVSTKNNTLARVRAIVRGDLALHVALCTDKKIRNEWTVTYVPTGQQVLIVRGAYAGRVAFRMCQTLSFTTIDARLMEQCNTIVDQLRQCRINVLFPRRQFVTIVETEALQHGQL